MSRASFTRLRNSLPPDCSGPSGGCSRPPAPTGPGPAFWLSALAGLLLALGLLVYAADRPAGHAALMPSFAALGTGALFGPLGLWLPSFVHPFAFSLLTAALRARGSSPAYRDCAAWWAVNVAFELAQHPLASALVAGTLLEPFGNAWPARLIANYLVRGTFDPGDLIAASLGALAAAAVLCLVRRMEVRHAH